jgi:hypothetical protein
MRVCNLMVPGSPAVVEKAPQLNVGVGMDLVARSMTVFHGNIPQSDLANPTQKKQLGKMCLPST